MKRIYLFTILAVSLLSASSHLMAQNTDQELKAIILHRDSLFWQTYNTCDVANMSDFFTDDVEFYHDKGGLTTSSVSLMESVKNGMCSSSGDFRLRREPVDSTLRVYALRKNNVIYGAVFTGQHVFYLSEKGGPSRLDGLARFSHVWLVKDGVWKMARILSYDHGPAPYINTRKAIALTAASLQKYTGKYKGAQSGTIEIRADKGLLVMQTDNQKMMLYPEKENVFFSKQRDLTFEFVKEGNKPAAKLIVRENGNVAEELLRD
jgi:hypothetical protein